MILADCVEGPSLLQRSLSLERLETESGANVVLMLGKNSSYCLTLQG